MDAETLKRAVRDALNAHREEISFTWFAKQAGWSTHAGLSAFLDGKTAGAEKVQRLARLCEERGWLPRDAEPKDTPHETTNAKTPNQRFAARLRVFADDIEASEASDQSVYEEFFVFARHFVERWIAKSGNNC